MKKSSLKTLMFERINRSSEIVFLREDFSDLSGYDQIGRGLRELVKDGQLVNIGYGLYTKSAKDKVTEKIFIINTPGIVEKRALKRLQIVDKNSSRFSRTINIPQYHALRDLPGLPSERLSRRLSLEFAYDWSNSKMPAETLILKAVENPRFRDLLTLSQYYGLPRVRAIAESFYSNQIPRRVAQIFSNIQIGMSEAEKEKAA